MKNLKKVVLLLLVAAMMISVFAGCGGQSTKETTGSTTAAAATTATSAEDPLKDKMEISFAMWGAGAAFDNSKPDAVRDQIYKDLNITINPQNVTWDDYAQKIQVWAVSGQLPDMFAIDLFGTTNYGKWIDQGLLKALPADLSAYPNINKLMTSTGFDIYKYPMGDANGKIYALPRLNHMSIDDWSTDCGVIVRKDWMAKVGVTKEPETMDEFIDLMTKFVNNDCNGNGKKDEIGLTMYNAGWLNWFQLAYEPGVQSGGWVKDPSDAAKWIPAFMTPKTLEGIKALKKLYDAGGLDKDFASLKGEEGRDKFASSTAGAYAHDLTPSTLAYVQSQFDKMPQNKGVDFASVITVLKPFKNADGNYYRHIAPPAWSETYINANCDDKKTDRILRLMDYFMGEKGYNLIHFGIEGTDWHKDGDKIVLDPTKGADGKDVAITVKYPVTGAGFIMEWSGTRQWTNPSTTPALQKMSSDLNDWLQANAKAVPTDLKIGYLDVPSKEKATANYSNDLIKCILAKDVDKTWNDLIAGYKANGYDTYISDINAKATELGIKPQ